MNVCYECGRLNHRKRCPTLSRTPEQNEVFEEMGNLFPLPERDEELEELLVSKLLSILPRDLDNMRECGGCEDPENHPHAFDCEA